MNSRQLLGLAILSTMSLAVASHRFGKQSETGGTQHNSFQAGALHAEAPPETALLGQLVGVWEAEQTFRNRDGSWSEKKTHAEWRWYYILDGHAIQDDWIKPPMSDTLSETQRVFGTNIRIYNAGSHQWEMAWIDTNKRRTATFTAVNLEGRVIMTGQNAAGHPIRNTFYDMTETSFKWEQEWTRDGGTTWFPVARISCTRKVPVDVLQNDLEKK